MTAQQPRVQVICPTCRIRIPVHPNGVLMVHRGHGAEPCRGALR